MKKMYLFVLLSLLGIMSYANVNSDDFAMKLESGKKAYGYCINSADWTAGGPGGPGGPGAAKPYGIYSFDMTAPTTITKEVLCPAITSAIVTGVYYDDNYYVVETKVAIPGTMPTEYNQAFSKINAETGKRELIATWKLDLSFDGVKAMTVDYSTTPPSILGLKSHAMAGMSLSIINVDNGAFTPVASENTPGQFITLACDMSGNVYAVNNTGILHSINRTSGVASVIGTNTGVRPIASEPQSMNFDHDNGMLYWANCTGQPPMMPKECSFGTIDVATGLFTKTGKLGKDAQMAILNIPFTPIPDGVPAVITDFTVTPADNGANSAKLQWTNPSFTHAGESLSTITKVEIYRDGVLIHTVNTPVIGSEGTYDDTVYESDIYTYSINASNDTGTGKEASVQLFVGEDKPGKPTNVIATKNGMNAVITWNAPTDGLNDGWFDASAVAYKVTRLPDNVVVASNTTELTITDSNITALDSYSYEVKAKTMAGSGGVETSNVIVVGPSLQVPYICDFGTTQLFNLWTVIDANTDGTTWQYNASTKDVSYSYNSSHSGNDWLISPSISLQQGKTYKLSFDIRTRSAIGEEKLAVYYGQGATVDAQTNPLGEYIWSNLDYSTKSAIITPSSAGDYNIGFKDFSAANQYGVYLTNVIVEEMLDNDLAATQVIGNVYPIAKSEYNYDVTITNLGSKTQNSYAVQLIDDSQPANVLATVNVTQAIASNETKTVTIKWTPTTANTINIRGKVILTGDQKTDNDLSSPFQISIQPEGSDPLIAIGDGIKEAQVAPVNLSFKTSVSQAIYLADQINAPEGGGFIKKVTYSYNNLNAESITKPITLHLINTDLSVTTAGWIPTADFALVYDGTITIEPGKGKLEITLSTPFKYTGGNLCIMVMRPMETSKTADAVHFYQTATVDDRSIVYANDYSPFSESAVVGVFKYKQFPNVVLQMEYANYDITLPTIEGAEVVPAEGYTINVLHGKDFKFTVSLAPSYSQSTVVVKANNETLTAASGVYTIANITEDKTITIENVAINKYAITWSNPTGATIIVKHEDTPLTSGAEVEHNSILTITAEASTGYTIGVIAVNGIDLTSSSYTVVGSTAITATVTINKYAVTWTNPTAATITVKKGATNITSGTEVDHGTELTITAQASTGYTLGKISVNGTELTGSSYNVTAPTQISVETTINKYIVTWANPTGATIVVKNGEINIEKMQQVDYNTTLTITATLDEGYTVVKIKANDIPLTGNTYTITDNTTISAEAFKPYTITVIQTPNGTISPETSTVNHGDNKTFIFTPISAEEYEVKDVLVDGVSLGAKDSYELVNVTQNHTITALFGPRVGVENIDALSLELYPNPVRDILNIKGQYQSLEIFNMAGQLLVTANGEALINVSNLPSGTYIVKAISNDKQATYKLIK